MSDTLLYVPCHALLGNTKAKLALYGVAYNSPGPLKKTVYELRVTVV